MVEFDTSKIGYSLKLDGKYYNTLDIEGFSHMMKDRPIVTSFIGWKRLSSLLRKA